MTAGSSQSPQSAMAAASYLSNDPYAAYTRDAYNMIWGSNFTQQAYGVPQAQSPMGYSIQQVQQPMQNGYGQHIQQIHPSHNGQQMKTESGDDESSNAAAVAAAALQQQQQQHLQNLFRYQFTGGDQLAPKDPNGVEQVDPSGVFLAGLCGYGGATDPNMGHGQLQ